MTQHHNLKKDLFEILSTPTLIHKDLKPTEPLNILFSTEYNSFTAADTLCNII